MDNKKYIQIMTIVVIGALIYAVGATLMTNLNTLFTTIWALFDQTTTATTGTLIQPKGYFAWFKTANVLVALMVVAILIMSVCMLFMDKETKKAKVFAWSTLGCYIAIILLTLIVFWTLPSTPTLGVNGTHTGLTSFATTMRTNVVAVVTRTLVFTIVASWQIWTIIFGGRSKKA